MLTDLPPNAPQAARFEDLTEYGTWGGRATKQAARNAKMAELAAASGLALPADMVQARPDALGGAERDGFGERAAVTRVGRLSHQSI